MYQTGCAFSRCPRDSLCSASVIVSSACSWSAGRWLARRHVV